LGFVATRYAPPTVLKLVSGKAGLEGAAERRQVVMEVVHAHNGDNAAKRDL